MADIRCDFCGQWMPDIAETCPNCGATNVHFKRLSDGTPRTIEQLKEWYRARNLPPENVTRFFIGKDIKEPKAIGIYEENGKYIVYKNKADGSRAIRYNGRDEAYAVNEVYLKLKEEILNQKAHNQNNQNKYAKILPNSVRYEQQQRAKRRKGRRLKLLPIFAGIYFGIYFALMFLVIGFFTTVGIYDSLAPRSYYYYLSKDNSTLYYYQHTYSSSDNDWWQYNFDEKEWAGVNTEKIYPDHIRHNNESTIEVISAKLDIPKELLDIHNSDEFLKHNKSEKAVPQQDYYLYNDECYYYLNDNHHGMAHDNSGWYRYRWDDNEWEYYCDYLDHDTLGDELWYYSSNYKLDNIVEYMWSEDDGWSRELFYDTEWYAAYSENNAAWNESHSSSYDNYNDNSSYDSGYDSGSSWDNDSDWDWDSSSDWDSDWSDWDSDW